MKNTRETIRDFMAAYSDTFPFSGTLLVAKGPEILYEAAFGQANRAFNIPNTTSTRFPIASLTKAFTAMAVMILVEKGQVSLHEPAKTYLPDFASIDEKITLHHLLCHSSGMPDYKLESGQKLHEFFSTPLSPAQFCEAFLGKEPLFAPGEKFAYSNPGYYLLGLAIETVSGQSFGAFLEEQIFTPLDMKHSGVDDPTVIIPFRATPFEYKNRKFVHAPFTDARNFYPQGGLYSTVGDLAKWNQAIHSDHLISPANRDLIFSPQATVSEPGNIFYGYGWHLVERFGRKVWGHGGSHWGYRSHLEYSPEDGLMVAVLSNYGFQDTMKVADNLIKICLEKPWTLPKKPDKVALPLPELHSFLGTYRSGNYTIKVFAEDEKIYIDFNGDTVEVYPIGQDTFQHIFIDERYPITQNKNRDFYLWGCKKE